MVVAATGFFDGVHTGHKRVLKLLSQIAAEQGKRSAVITFWPHPRSVLRQDASQLRLLSTLDEKRDLILSAGVDEVIVIPFTKEFSQLSTEEFLKEYLAKRYNVSTLIIGYDHRLGHDADMTPQKLMEISAEAGIETRLVDAFQLGESVISSTKIRRLIAEGRIVEANEFLGYRYQLTGVVVAGERLGRKLGFPTTNMQLYNPLKAIPAFGVYAVTAEVEGRVYAGVCNIGIRPTVSNKESVSIETHILSFNEDIYGLDLKVSFLQKLRDERRFPSTDALVEQMKMDKIAALEIVSTAQSI